MFFPRHPHGLACLDNIRVYLLKGLIIINSISNFIKNQNKLLTLSDSYIVDLL